MTNFIIALLFIAVAVNVPATLALLKGLMLTTTESSCPQEIKDVKNNILAIKIIQTANTVIFAVALLVISIW
jgi:hypothetical protein